MLKLLKVYHIQNYLNLLKNPDFIYNLYKEFIVIPIMIFMILEQLYLLVKIIVNNMMIMQIVQMKSIQQVQILMDIRIYIIY
ncbi:unnamed protein product [Paramecium sonneborni]|uniref:Transmembrane protein n=1 Tax=Paramecium sonneborni TaxID=65129 RepID=A0A8S1RV57_9CILI|nr:unnamed protein product [Paramecium sonneborni]